MIKADPIAVPENVQLSVTITARDAVSLKLLSGQVKIDNEGGRSIGVPFSYTFSRKPHRVFDPDTQTSQTVNILPVMSVVVGGYPETQVPLSISLLRIWVEPTAIAVGPPLQVIVHAEDVGTKQPIAGKVKIGNQVLGDTNTAFTYTFSPTPPAAIVTATGYVDTPVLWPPTHPAQLLVTISPTVTFGKKVRYIVKALDSVLKTEIPNASVSIDNKYVAQSGTWFDYTFTLRRENGAMVGPTITVSSPGYPDGLLHTEPSETPLGPGQPPMQP